MNPVESNGLAAQGAESADAVAMRDTLERRKAALGATVARRIREAMQARQDSGIEEIWQEDADQYEGIDELSVNTRHNTNSPLREPDGSTPRSRVFMNITKPKTEVGVARVQEMLVPHDDKPWEIGPTPIPELDDAVEAKDQTPLTLADGTQAPAEVVAKTLIAKAAEKALGMADWIEDQLVEGSAYAEMRAVIRDAGRIGTGILKGPFPVYRESRKWSMQDGVSALQIVSALGYQSKRIDPRDFFPDPSCGENIHQGSFVCERAYMTARQLRKLAQEDGYDAQAIALALREGPKRKARTDTRDTTEGTASDSQVFEVWFYYGDVEPEDLVVMGVVPEQIPEEDIALASVPSIVTMLNDRPIKAVVNPLETGEFPYDVFPWRPVEGQIWGRGIPRAMAVAQRGLNAALRAMLRNAGLSAGAQIGIMEGALAPANGRNEIVGDKVWLFRPNEFCDDIRKAMNVWTIPSIQEQMANIIVYFEQKADELTNLPMLLQGMQGTAPELLGGMKMLMANAMSPLRVIAKQFDDFLIVPHLKRYYAAGMQDGPEDAKGDLTVKARGSSALVQRDISREFMVQAYQLAQRPGSRIDPDKLDMEVMRSHGINVDSITFTDEVWKDRQEQMAQQPPPKAPAVEAAEIRANAQVQVAQSRDQLMVEKIKVDTDRDTMHLQAQTERTAMEREGMLEELRLRERIALLQYATQERISLQDAKVALARDTMKLTLQRELAGADGEGPQVAEPPTEPEGRAADGRAYQE